MRRQRTPLKRIPRVVTQNGVTEPRPLRGPPAFRTTKTNQKEEKEKTKNNKEVEMGLKADPKEKGRATTRVAPLAVTSGFRANAPRIRMRDGGYIIEKEEPLGTGTLDGSTGFQVTRFMLNPAYHTTFNWLSGMADRFERYQFEWVKIRYVPRCSTTTTGAVTIAYEPDVTDEAPGTEADLLNYYCAEQDAAWAEIGCTLPGSMLHKNGPGYTRTFIRGGDNRVSDAGMLVIATNGMADLSTVGRLFISYRVRLTCPHAEINDDARPAQMIYAQGSLNQAVTANTWYPVTLSTPFGTPYPFNTASGSALAVPPGVYCVNMHFFASSSATGTSVLIKAEEYDALTTTWSLITFSQGAGTTWNSGAFFRTGADSTFMFQATPDTAANNQYRSIRFSINPSASITLSNSSLSVHFIPA
jgi:hypothetical protein